MVRTFRTRLIISFTALAALVLMVSFGAVWLATSQQSERTLERELEVSERVFNELMDVRAQQLQQTAEVLTTDFGFREAIASKDQNTIISALVNHGERIGTDLMVLQSPVGEEIAATHAMSWQPQSLGSQRVSAQLMLVEESIFQVVSVPVMAPDLIAWATLGFEVDDEFATLMRQLTHADITFINDSSRAIYATSLPAQARQKIASEATELPTLFASLNLATHSSALADLPIAATEDSTMLLVFSADRQEAASEFRTLQQQYLIIALAILVVAVLLAVFTARMISSPVAQLTRSAKRLGQGDYSSPITLTRNDEFGALGHAFEQMRQGISAREQQIVYQLEHDILTGLPNRNSLQQELASRLKNQQRGHVVLVNIARFREVNDRFGQLVGDDLLHAVAERLRDNCGSHWWLSRLAGDEFVLLSHKQSETSLKNLLTQLQAALSQPFWLAETSYLLEFHAGYLAFPNVGDDADSLLRRAQICARFAKQQKQFAVVYQQGMDEQHLRRIQIVQALPSAVRENRLQLHFQPKLRCIDGAVIGVEALLRWRDDALGVVRPDEFIPLAEQTGEINRLTRWVCMAAFDQLQLWHEQGRQLSVAINLSAVDLQWDELVAFLTEGAQQRGIPCHLVTLEVTESAVMLDPEQAIMRLQELRDSGFKIALDDYGTGYASLGQLKRLPVDELKLDRAFIQDIVHSDVDMAIVRSTLALAHQLGLATVAEGIEEQAAWHLLRDLQCDTMQGFFFSRPLAAPQFEQWVVDYQANEQIVQKENQ